MDYPKIYQDLIDRAKVRNLETYTEKHHILPRCLGGNNRVENLVSLTPEEHFLAHLLLTRMYPTNKKILFAAHMMTVGRSNNKLYGWLRRQMSEASKGNKNHMYGRVLTSEERALHGRAGKENAFYGKRHTNLTKEKLSEVMKGRVGAPAWNKGIKLTEEHKANISSSSPWKGTHNHPRQGKPHSVETKQKLSDLIKGRKMSNEFIEKISKPKGPQKRIVCIHCKKEGGISNMTRFHNENCKDKT